MKSAFVSLAAVIGQEVMDALFTMRFELVAFFSAAMLCAILSPKRHRYEKAQRKQLKAKLSEYECLDARQDSEENKNLIVLQGARQENKNLIALQGALDSNNFDEAFHHFSRMWRAGGSSMELTQDIMEQLVKFACKKHQLHTLLPSLQYMSVPESAINAMLNESIFLKDSTMALRVERIARAQQGSLEDSTYSLLIKSLMSRPSNVRKIIEEVFTRDGPECSPELVLSVLCFCGETSDSIMADVLFERVKPKQSDVLSAFIRFYLRMQECERAFEVFEDHVQNMSTSVDEALVSSLMEARARIGKPMRQVRAGPPPGLSLKTH